MRADAEAAVPTDLHVEYYSSRASAGIILTECSAIRRDGNCFLGSCSIYTDEQVEGWKRVTDAVHAKGGRIFLQIWHGGRAAHSSHIEGKQPICPSAIAINATVNTPQGRVPHIVPRELAVEEIQQLV